MSIKHLAGKRVAVLAADGSEQRQFELPRQALKIVGAETVLVSPRSDFVTGRGVGQSGAPIKMDVQVGDAEYGDYDALFIPGGEMNINKLRHFPEAVDFVRSFFTASKPVATTCHGPLLLIDANVVRARKVTSCPSIKAELINAGAIWLDDPVVVHNGLVTNQKPDDIPIFTKTMIDSFWKYI